MLIKYLNKACTRFVLDALIWDPKIDLVKLRKHLTKTSTYNHAFRELIVM